MPPGDEAAAGTEAAVDAVPPEAPPPWVPAAPLGARTMVADLPLPPVGSVSGDRVAVMGAQWVGFLYAGGNDYYGQYFSRDPDVGRRWAELTWQRHTRLSAHCGIVSLFVPNKATCMPDLYPLPLPSGGTPAWRRLRHLTAGDSSVLFADGVLAASAPGARDERCPWARFDSHWTPAGAVAAADEVLRTLGLDPVPAHMAPVDPRPVFGDLSERWLPLRLYEEEVAEPVALLPEPTLVLDTGRGAQTGHVVGRRTRWECPDAAYPVHLVVVGNSFAGVGDRPGHLTWWLARLVQQVSFVHSPAVPADLLEACRPDVVVFQGTERFLPVVPEDTVTVEGLDARYRGGA